MEGRKSKRRYLTRVSFRYISGERSVAFSGYSFYEDIEEINKATNQSIYRSHEPPSPEKYKSLIDLVGQPLSKILIGKVPHPSLMNKILDEIKGSPEYESVNQSILRSQSQAKYENKNKSHFGLALKNYVHFTSPIRRYADLLVHRQIISIINKTLIQNDENNDLKSICDHISNTERKSIVAERKTVDRYISLLYQNKINEIVYCSIISIHKFGVFVSALSHKEAYRQCPHIISWFCMQYLKSPLL